MISEDWFDSARVLFGEDLFEDEPQIPRCIEHNLPLDEAGCAQCLAEAIVGSEVAP
jgi:hypothetical protein